MIGWLIVNEFLRGSKFEDLHERLREEAENLKITLEIRTNAALLAALSLKGSERPDFILFWDKDVWLAQHLESMGVPVFNSAYSIEVCDSKAKTHLVLSRKCIPVAKTIIAPMTYENIGYTNLDFIKNIEKELSYPLIIKESFGSFGQQVYLIHHKEELMEKTKDLQGKSFLYQEYIKSSHGKDIRIQVVGKQVIASMLRTSERDFRANITNGGKMQSYEPTSVQCELAIKACQAVGADFAGVDLLFGEDETMLVCEVNSNAHFVNLEDCTGINVASVILHHIKEKCR